VCGNVSAYVFQFCIALSKANPSEQVSCRADSLDGVPCTDNICACNQLTGLRRLLTAATCNLVIIANHITPSPDMPATLSWLGDVAVVSTVGGPGNSYLDVAIACVLFTIFLAAAVIWRGKYKRKIAKKADDAKKTDKVMVKTEHLTSESLKFPPYFERVIY
jgi:hypothetical protein